MNIFGKIVRVYPNERIIQLQIKNRRIFLYMSRKFFKDFGPYFVHRPYIFVEVSTSRKHHGLFYAYDILAFQKIAQHYSRERKVFYDIVEIRKSIQQIAHKKQYRIFLDLEFSLPSYHYNKVHIPEIVQYGMVIENENGEVVLEDQSLVQPNKSYSLNKRTLKFISRVEDDFEEAVPYVAFYQLLEKYIRAYDAKIIVWGKNDILTIEHSFKLNRLQPLDIRNRYINLMQLMKNYYNTKNDLGLFDTYQKLSGILIDEQSHDAFQDARVERDIFHMFKKQIKQEEGK